MDKARLYALQNALKFDGKANSKAVMGQLLKDDEELKKDPKRAQNIAEDAVTGIAGMTLEQIRSELEENAPEMLEKKVREKHGIFDSYDVKGPITAFPPEPSKYPHIGHAKAIIVNYEFAKQKKGKFILRFEDTNPTLAKQEFYDIHLDNYKWLGIELDKIDYASDHMEEFYKLAEKMITLDKAYVCSCSQESMKEGRMKKRNCECRDSADQIERWRAMKKAKEGEMVLRAKIDIAHKNSAMRDPSMMRIIDGDHPRTKDKYRLWPTYDFENSCMDGIEKVTHRFRSKEFELRNELQRWIQSALGFKETSIFEFARFNMEGVESSGRIIRDMIEKGELSGWDDPSLTTLVALRRRGFTAKAIWDFVLSTGITKNEATLTWDDLIKHNKRVLDSTAERYFFIANPVKIRIKGAPKQKIILKKHPDKDLGVREFETHEEFYIAKDDHKHIKDGELWRLMDCLNFEKKGKEFVFISQPVDDYKKRGKGILHWLPEGTPADVRMPDNKVIKGLVESNDFKTGDIVQFERFGFARVDSPANFWFSHK